MELIANFMRIAYYEITHSLYVSHANATKVNMCRLCDIVSQSRNHLHHQFDLWIVSVLSDTESELSEWKQRLCDS